MENRKLIFRAWDGETFYCLDLNEDISDTTAEYLQMFFKLPKEQLITYDFHNNAVFEGDLVQANSSNKYELKYYDGSLSFELRNIATNDHRTCIVRNAFEKGGYRVIGNIHQGITDGNNEK